jgi:hypothetical protein
MKNKITKNKIKEIKELKEQGLRRIEISKKLKINPYLISYYSNDDFRKEVNEKKREKYNKLTKREKHQLYLSRKEYQKGYFKERYNLDPIFRAKHQERARNYKRRKNDKK